MTNARIGGRVAALLVAGAAALYLLLAVRQAGKPLQLDAVDLAFVGRSIAAGDGPLLDRGLAEQAWNGFLLSPVAGYLLGIAFALAGAVARTAQLAGALAALVTAAAGAATVRALVEPEAARRAVPFFVALFLLTPYALQVFAVPAAETLATAPLLALLVLSLARLAFRAGHARESPPGRVERAAPALLLALLLATGPRAAALGIVATAWLAPVWGWRRLLRFGALTLLVAVELYVVGLVAFEIVGEVATSPAPARLVSALAGLVGAPGDPAAIAATLGRSTLALLRWSGALPWLALVLAVARRPADAGGPGASPRALRGLALVALALAGLALAEPAGTYAGVPPLFAAPLLAPALVPVAALLARGASSPPRPVAWIVATVAGLGSLLAGALVVGDRIVLHAHLTGRTLWPDAALLVIPALFALAAIAVGSRRPGARAALVALAVATQIGAQAGVALAQSGVEYSTSYNYGQVGMPAAVEALRARARSEDGVLCMKDVAFRLERPYWHSLPAFYSDDGEREVLRLLRLGRIRFAVFTARAGQDVLESRPELARWIAEHAIGVETYGDYRLFELGAPAGAPDGAAPAAR